MGTNETERERGSDPVTCQRRAPRSGPRKQRRDDGWLAGGCFTRPPPWEPSADGNSVGGEEAFWWGFEGEEERGAWGLVVDEDGVPACCCCFRYLSVVELEAWV